MMKSIFEFLKTQFSRMPRPVQVVVYLLLVAVFVFELTKPNVITARVVMKDVDGGEDHYRGQRIMVDYAGHLLKFSTNEDGLMVIPAPVTSINVRIDLSAFLDIEDHEKWHEVKIDMTDFWFRDVVKIVLSDQKPMVAVEPRFAKAEGTLFDLGQLVQNRIAKRAHAGTLQQSAPAPTVTISPLSVPSPPSWKKHTAAKVNQVKQSIYQIISSAAGIPAAVINDRFELQRNPKLNFRTRVRIISAVEKRYGFRIPDEHWMSIGNIGELVNYVLDRQKIYQQHKIEKIPDWYQYQRQIPEQQRPIFKR